MVGRALAVAAIFASAFLFVWYSSGINKERRRIDRLERRWETEREEWIRERDGLCWYMRLSEQEQTLLDEYILFGPIRMIDLPKPYPALFWNQETLNWARKWRGRDAE